MTAGTSEDRRNPPEHVGPYRIGERIGTGGMGEVYRAYDRRLGRWVAVKQVLPGEDEDTDAREWLLREARAIASLNHASIIQIHDIVETEPGDWIVMELVEGQTLRDLAVAGPIDLRRVLQLAQEIAEGLAAAHAKGVVHRDLKTENVMVTPAGHAKILDFGVAKRLQPGQSDSSPAPQGTIFGTSRTMSPEQVNGQPVDHRSDLFSLGILLFETVTGHSPFLDSDFIETLLRIQNYQQPPVREVNGQVPEELASLIDRLLEKDPDRRPQSAAEVVAALKTITGTPGRGLPAASRSGSAPRSPGELTATQVAPVVALRSLVGSTDRRAGRSGRSLPSASRRRRDRQSTSGIFIKTLLLISLVDGTGRAHRLEQADDQLLRQHDRLMRELLREYHGLEIDREGDFLILFDRPVDAVGFMMVYHGKLSELSRKHGDELRTRAGVHLGEVFLRENPPAEVLRGAKPLEVEGAAKLIAERVASLAGEGQILLTQEAYELSRRTMAKHRISGRKLRGMDFGRYRFSGVDESVRIFDVRPEASAAPSPPPDTEDAHRIPEDRPEDPRVREWILAASAVLALVIFGVWFFSPTTSQLTPRPSVAVLGFENQGLAEKNWMSTALAEMFSSELATGEELRLISGESVARMKRDLSLSKTDSLTRDEIGAIEDYLNTDYVVGGSYRVSKEEEGEQIRLVLRLERTDAEEGEEAIEVADTGTTADLFDLVSETAMALREKLGVGELSEAEVEAVRASVSSNPEAFQLYSKGLEKLRSFDALTARDRFKEAVAEDPDYALVHAALSEAWQALGYDEEAKKSAARALELAEEQKLPREQVLSIEGRFHGVAGDWQSAVSSYKVLWGFFPDNVEYGLRLAEAQTTAGRTQEALATVDSLRQLPEPAGDDPRIDLAEAAVATSLSDYQRELEATGRAMEKGLEQGASTLVAEALMRRGWALRYLGKPAEAKAALEEANRRFSEAGDKGRKAQVLYYIARLFENQGYSLNAERLYREALRIHEETGNTKAIARTQASLGVLIQERGELEEAERMFVKSVEYAREIGDRRREAGYLGTLAFLKTEQGHLERAEELAQQNMAICEEIGFREGEAWGYFILGKNAFAAGKVRIAQAWYEEALVIGQEIGFRRQAGYVLDFQAKTLLAIGDLAGAMQKADESRAIRSELGEQGALAETELTRARILLELDQPSEAEALAREAAREFRERKLGDLEASAVVVLARVLLARGKLSEAQEVFAPIGTYEGGQKPAFRLPVAITAARLQAASGEYDAALLRLGGVVAEATELGLGGLELEARLAQGEIELAAGVAESRARLATLAEEAEEKGFGLIARKAAAASRAD
ncbi:MAG: protein kinase [bacterium]|nr:protein kinase [bacterium]